MIRLVQMGGKWYGMKISVIDDDEVESIEHFVECGEPVLYCYDLDDVAEFLDIDAVEMVEME